MNQEIEIIYSKRCVAQAALLFWKKRDLSIRAIVFFSTISLFLVLSVAFQKEKIGLMELVVLFILLIMPWGTLVFFYFILLIRILGQLRPILGRTIKYVLHDDRISWSTDHGVKEVLWSDLDMYAKSSEVTLFYSSKTKRLLFFPNAMLSEKAQAYMSEKFNEAVNARLKPPVIPSASDIKRKYLAAFLIILVLAVVIVLGIFNIRLRWVW